MRLDHALLERCLVTTRSKAQELIRGKKVKVDGQVVSKCGHLVSESEAIELLELENPFVSRSGTKLQGFLDQITLNVKGTRALDVGISTGGFSQCLLHRGVREVVGVDVGTNQLAIELRGNPSLILNEKTDIRNWAPEAELAKFDLIVVDVSFISLELVLPHVVKFLSPTGDAVVLVKPQFEVGKSGLNKNGIVKDVHLQNRAVEKISALARQLGLIIHKTLPSSVKGGDGNQEYFLWLGRNSSA